MSFFDAAIQLVDRISSPQAAQAHCDVPCGIYDTAPMKIAANTVLTLTQKMLALDPPKPGDDKQVLLGGLNTASRMIMVKEQHAEICKRELLILWTDWFKPPHVEQFPELHNLVWTTAKLCSKCKQEVNVEAAEQLFQNVNKVADIFSKSGYNMPNAALMAG
jgi:nickel superoxide dismutase